MAALSADRCRSALFTLITGSLISAPLAAPLAAPLPGRSEVLYTLTTRCSLDGGKAQPCQVEATNSKTTTLYRHTIGAVTETIQISGIIRQEDIGRNNKVYSRRMANALISYTGTGEVSNAGKVGWGTNLLMKIWPF